MNSSAASRWKYFRRFWSVELLDEKVQASCHCDRDQVISDCRIDHVGLFLLSIWFSCMAINDMVA
jgi:hypothetical protein